MMLQRAGFRVRAPSSDSDGCADLSDVIAARGLASRLFAGTRLDMLSSTLPIEAFKDERLEFLDELEAVLGGIEDERMLEQAMAAMARCTGAHRVVAYRCGASAVEFGATQGADGTMQARDRLAELEPPVLDGSIPGRLYVASRDAVGEADPQLEAWLEALEARCIVFAPLTAGAGAWGWLVQAFGMPKVEADVRWACRASARAVSEALARIEANLHQRPWVHYTHESGFRTSIDTFFREASVFPEIVSETNDLDLLRLSALSGIGLTAIPRHFVEQDLAHGDLVEVGQLELSAAIYVCHPDEALADFVSRAITLLTQFLDEA